MKKRTKNILGRNFKKLREKDKLSKKQRSELMSKIRSSNTRFENDFITLLKKRTKKRFSTHVKNIRGTPDIVFEKDKICVFLDSDFWHGWQYPRWKHLLKNDFWRGKIENNRKRDRRITSYLRRQGWNVLRIWEHEIKHDIGQSITNIFDFLKKEM